MIVPAAFLSNINDDVADSSVSDLGLEERNRLYRRKGGVGHGSGGHSSGSKGGISGSKGSSAAKSHGASSSFTNSRSGGAFGLTKSTKSTASAYSDGGGKPVTLGSDSPFSGRQAGGGTRKTIYGTSRFGSGYPYGDYGLYVSSRPLPYQFYPVPVSYNYYGGDEYLNVDSTERPGGNLVTAIVQPAWNTSSVTYRIVGDNASVTAVFDALVANCSVVNSSSAITAFTPSSSTWPLPEQIVQYYRASSLALSLDGYNNTASLLSNMPASNTSAAVTLADTALPDTLNSTFLMCVNTTTGASVPLEDVASHKLSATIIATIVTLSLLGAVTLLVCVCSYCSHSSSSRRSRKEKEKEKERNKKKREYMDSLSLAKEGVRISQPIIRVSEPVEAQTARLKHASLDARSIDERTLTSESVIDKKRWSCASPQSTRLDGIEEHKSADEQPRYNKHIHDSSASAPMQGSKWLSKIPFLGSRTRYQSVKAGSRSNLPLARSPAGHDDDKHSELGYESGSERADTPSPSPSPYSSTFARNSLSVFAPTQHGAVMHNPP